MTSVSAPTHPVEADAGEAHLGLGRPGVVADAWKRVSMTRSIRNP